MIVRCSGGVFLRLATVAACAVGTARAPNAGAQVSPGARPTAPSRYDDLVTLFTAWRAFQQPKVVNGVPDYSPAAMAAQHRELATYRQRLDTALAHWQALADGPLRDLDRQVREAGLAPVLP